MKRWKSKFINTMKHYYNEVKKMTLEKFVGKEDKEFKWLDVNEDLEFSELREIRQHTIDQIKKSIEDNGFDEARVLLVIPSENEGKYIVAGGNHRLQALRELNIKKVPCLIDYEGDLYKLAIMDNEAEKTYAPIDLFDWLNIIKNLKKNHTQEEIEEKIGWKESKVKDHSALLKNIVEEVLNFCKLYQEERSTKKVDISTFNFSRGWFYNSGLYNLTSTNQMKFMNWFCVDKKCTASNRAITEETERYKEIQDQLILLEDLLDPTLKSEDVYFSLIESIESGEYTTERLKSVVKRLNEGAQDKAVFGIDCREGLKQIEDNSIDCIITDPPWGVEYTPSRGTNNPKFDKELGEILTLLDEVFKECKRVAKANAHIYVFFPTTFYTEFKELLEKYFFVYPIPLVWYKNNHNLCEFKQRYASIYETIFFCKMENGNMRKLNYNVSPDVLPFKKVNKKVHDTQKPEDLLEYLINNSTGANEIVLDPFTGSGSTLLSAAKNNRHYIGFEEDKTYESNFKRKLGEILEEIK